MATAKVGEESKEVDWYAKNPDAVYARFDAKALIEALRTVNAYNEECRATLDSQGLSFCTVDPAHVAFVKLNLPAKEGPTGECVFGLVVNELVNFLRHVQGTSLAQEHVDVRVEHDQLNVRMGPISRMFKQQDPAGMLDPKPLNLVDAKACVQIRSKALRDALRVLSDESDHVEVKLSKGLEIKAEGDGDVMTYTLPIEQLGEAKQYAPMQSPDAHSSFPTSYLIDVLEAHAEHDGWIWMAVGDDYPLRFLWEAGGGKVEVFVAPRIPRDA